MARGIYIHIPFCHQICNYCDFNKFFFHNQPVDEYIEAVGQELQLWKRKAPEAFATIETVFLGGGTPTSLTPAQITRLLTHIKAVVPLAQIAEFSSEANPDELSEAKLEALFAGGVNRLSMGVQTFDEALLKKLGRTHKNADVLATIEAAKRVGFTNISIDLMYGLPQQTMAQWQSSLQQALALELPHYSAYSLIVEPKTIFYNQHVKGKLPLPSEDLEADMYALLMEEMQKQHLQQYEISNFAQPNHASTHNKIYWDNDEYIGIGAGAHGYVNGVRYNNHGPLKKYLAHLENGELPIVYDHKVSAKERREEQMFLGLRKMAGVTHATFYARFNESIDKVFPNTLPQLTNQGLIEVDEVGVRLTQKGKFLGNTVFQQFLLEE